MKAIKLLLVSFLVVCFSTTNVVASKESDAAKIQRAMKAAPSSISAGAEIRDVDPEWTVLREAEDGNEWTCFPGVPLNDGDKHPMCNDAVWMEWLDAVANGSIFPCGFFDVEPVVTDCSEAAEPWTPDTVGYSYMLRGDALVNNWNPMSKDQNDGGLWDQEGPHLMMVFPPLVNLSDLPTAPFVVGSLDYDVGGPYVMWGGTPLIHVMVPLTDRDR
jgi:hypothetical protein